MKNIEEIRKSKKISQEKLARKIDISVSQYRNIEKRKSDPSVTIAIKIAKELNEKVEDLFEIC